jgi:mannose-6-phosphate isomerase-like protein (cupin superfamily)
MTDANTKYRMVNFKDVPGVQCPCGIAHRSFDDYADFPATVHVTEITLEARLHYHKRLTETYYFLECESGARMQLDDEIVGVEPGTCIVIPPGVRHRAIGRMKVLIFVLPKFDAADEWED